MPTVSKEHLLIGMANSSFSSQFIKDHPGVLDFIEIPYEQLVVKPQTATELGPIQKILHCASLGISGSSPPSYKTIDGVRHWAQALCSPWIGEHIAFVQAPNIDSEEGPDADGNIFHGYNVGYTVAPLMTRQTLDDTIRRVNELQTYFDAQIILENPPIYFDTPGSTMTQIEFIRDLTNNSSIGLLFDVAHFTATCANLGLDSFAELAVFPTEKIVEIHVSGVTQQLGLSWDDHALPASEKQLELIDHLLELCEPRALTLEYNWQANFPASIILGQVERIRHGRRSVSQ